MNIRATGRGLGRRLGMGVALAWAAGTAHAAGGLLIPAADDLWPQWQARIALQTAQFSAWSPQLGERRAAGGVQGGAVLGDYYFARPSFGAFRASGGLLIGAQGGAPMGLASAGPRLGLSVSSTGLQPAGQASDSLATLPYLGVGFSSSPWRSSLAFTADVGLTAERPSASRAVFGSQGLDTTLREMRLAPVLQLGVRYTF